jgi:hypothetical protein
MSEEGQVDTLVALRRIAGVEAADRGDGTERITMDQFRAEIGAPPRRDKGDG